MANLFDCDSCGYAIFSAFHPFFGLCPICFWEDHFWNDNTPVDEESYNRDLYEYRNQWPEHARKRRQELVNEDRKQGRRGNFRPLELGPSDDEMRDGGLEEYIIDKEASLESCKRLRPVVEALQGKISSQLQGRLAKALDKPSLYTILYEVLWALIKYEITLPEPLHAALANEDDDQWVRDLFARHTEKLRVDLEEVARAVGAALPEEVSQAYEECLRTEKYPSAARLLLPYVAEGSAHSRIMDRIAMRLELHGTRWEGLEERLYRLLSDLRGTITDADEWIFTNFLLHKEFLEGVEFWLWQIYIMSYPLPRPIYEEFALLAEEMGLEAFYMENIICKEK